MKYCIILALINLYLCLEIVEIPINEEIKFDTSQKEFTLKYSKETEKASIFILFYEKIGDVKIEIKSPDSDNVLSSTLYDENGYIYFPFTKNGDYNIVFNRDFKDVIFEGKFKIVSSDKPFTLDSNKDISFNSLDIKTESEPCPLIFSLENSSNKSYMKKVKVIDERSKIYLSENGSNYKEIIGEFIYFNKNSNYSIRIEFLEYEIYGIYIFSIQGFSLTNLESNLIKIEDFSISSRFYENNIYLFTKINLKDNNKFYVRTDDNLKFAYIDNEEQYNNFPNGIQYLSFSDSLINKEFIKIEKPQDKDYMILFIKFEDQENNLIRFVKEVIVELNKENLFDGVNVLFKLNYEKKK